ncbi:MAG: FliH/SctL family protein [Pseudomonadota bacterium]
MNAPAKFLFERDFDVETRLAPRSEGVPFEQYYAAIKAARTAGHAAGYQEGRSNAEKTADAQFAAHTSAVSEALSRIINELDKEIVDHAAASSELAMTVARVLAPTLVAREPLAELETLFTDCASHLKKTPKLTISVHDSLVEAAEKRLQPIADRIGFEGRMTVIGDPDVAIGDCRIIWSDGGVIRTIGDLDRTIRDRVDHYFEARRSLIGDTQHG